MSMEAHALASIDSLETLYRNADSALERERLMSLMAQFDKKMSLCSATLNMMHLEEREQSSEAVESVMRQLCSLRNSSEGNSGLIDSMNEPLIRALAEKHNPLALNLMGLSAMAKKEYPEAWEYFKEAMTVNDNYYLPALHNYAICSLYIAWIMRVDGYIEDADTLLKYAQMASDAYSEEMALFYKAASDEYATPPYTAAEYYHPDHSLYGGYGKVGYLNLLEVLRGEFLAEMVKAQSGYLGKKVKG